MKLTVLGRYGPYGKAATGAASGYLLEDKGTRLVLDMGAGVLSRLQAAVSVHNIDAVFISHLHYDHTSDLLPFRYLLEEKKRTITIITQYEDSEWYRLLFTHPNFNIINIDENSLIKTGSLELSFYEMKHSVKDYAIKVKGSKTFVYTGDTMFTPAIYKAFENADCALADCSKPVGFKGPHMTTDIAIKLHKATGVRLIATHLSPDYSPERDFAGIDGIETAQELKTYEI